MKLTIRQQLLGAFALDLLLLTALGAFALVQMAFMNHEASLIESRTIPTLRNVDRIHDLLRQYRSLQLEYLIHTSTADKSRLEMLMKELEREMAEHFERQDSFLSSDAERRAFARVVDAWQRLVEANHRQFLPAAGMGNTGSVQPAFSRLIPLHEELSIAAARLAVLGEEHATGALSEVGSAYRRARYVILAGTLGALVLSAAAAYRAQASTEAASEAKSLFLATMSHELRTPLNAILGYAQLLHLEAEARGEGAILPELARIQAAGKHLLSLISNILDFSKIEQGKVDLDLARFGVEPLAREVAAIVEPLAREGRNRLRLTCAPGLGEMWGDPAKVRQVLLNLLGNAAKFTRDGSITLAVEGFRNGAGEGYRFAVADTGIGIAEDQLERLFQPFSQVDRTGPRRVDGTGLGLVVSRQLCRLMGGEVTVESVEGEGSTFTVELPARVPEPGAETRSEPTTAPGFPRRGRRTKPRPARSLEHTRW